MNRPVFEFIEMSQNVATKSRSNNNQTDFAALFSEMQFVFCFNAQFIKCIFFPKN